jgi:hypothetical protein
MLLTNLEGGLDGASLFLPDDLLWSDEHSWSPVVASVSYLLNGALLVQSALRQAGRPITLVGAVDMAWVTRAVVGQLHDWAGVPLSANAGRFRLTLADGRALSVAFRHGETAIESEPVAGFPARMDSDFYRITVRLMQL